MYKLTFTNEYGNKAQDDNRAIFRVNRKKHKVACILHVTIEGFNEHYAHNKEYYNWDLDHYIAQRLRDYNIIKKDNHVHRIYLDGHVFSFVGIAICDPNDEFNEEIGKHIAETRARKQVYQLMEYINRFTKEYIDKMTESLNKAIEKTHFLKFREIDHERNLVRATMKLGENHETDKTVSPTVNV